MCFVMVVFVFLFCSRPVYTSSCYLGPAVPLYTLVSSTTTIYISIQSFVFDLSKKRKLSLWEKSYLCEARTHDIHIIARRSTTRKLPPYTTGNQKLTNELLTAHKRTSWEHDYVGPLRRTPITEFIPRLRFYPISAEARRAWCQGLSLLSFLQTPYLPILSLYVYSVN